MGRGNKERFAGYAHGTLYKDTRCGSRARNKMHRHLNKKMRQQDQKFIRRERNTVPVEDDSI